MLCPRPQGKISSCNYIQFAKSVILHNCTSSDSESFKCSSETWKKWPTGHISFNAISSLQKKLLIVDTDHISGGSILHLATYHYTRFLFRYKSQMLDIDKLCLKSSCHLLLEWRFPTMFLWRKLKYILDLISDLCARRQQCNH
ncbi:hypothetical protein EJB05_17484 [Eragrostis curvula]|uniref:Uncharacterized protein n=1 Tax=Eragrostis curvula TaxID=38414 RepID=A0A5J9VJA0_9POAL|nr:hypothetical protein EJB05_17484 [Eragrostis curvula]